MRAAADLSVPRVRDIQDAVCRSYALDRRALLSERRGRRVAWPRQVGMYLAWELTGFSLPRIGRLFGRDHSTVAHALKVVPRRLGEDRDERVRVAGIRAAAMNPETETREAEAARRILAAEMATHRAVATLFDCLRAAAEADPTAAMRRLDALRGANRAEADE